ncbi:MAG: hypothetical protein CG440_616, partial [Methanosaeta sp. NSM2]
SRRYSSMAFKGSMVAAKSSRLFATSSGSLMETEVLMDLPPAVNAILMLQCKQSAEKCLDDNYALDSQKDSDSVGL